ncbi:MAG: selenoprotein B glycine/betaine/sarcosine/D-proline reductase [Desulfobacteraceae bacterium]|nr:selenoprotein B glycine/betaine/sarcosine/D-proline reductase [Desulfobacteraceae bacterium]MBU4054018.1 glycine/betaine/sarcosine/D-proline family reductase selenoprotein B [Pseudomonadota bacterium]
MARLELMTPPERKHLEETKCPSFDTHPWVTGKPLNQRRVAMISTAGLHGKNDRPFSIQPGDFYRILPGDIQASDLMMSHLSANFDRSGFQQDWNVVFPLDRLRELAEAGVIGSVADFHYSFMGANDPLQLEPDVRKLAGVLKQDKVDALLLLPV